MASEDKPVVQLVYEILKESAPTPLTNKEIGVGVKAIGKHESGTTIYSLVKRGWAKRVQKGDYVAYTVTGIEPVFGPARTHRKKKFTPVFEAGAEPVSRKKRKYTRKNTALVHVADSPAPPAMTPEQIAQQGQQAMARSFSASQTLQSAALMLRFAEMMDEFGPEQTSMMLAGMQRLHAK